ncbi:MAG: NUDIX hydrolase [Clostridia bacterium]|nr:NUDIX hydrolase [Clostridia bacterium]
MSFIEKKISGKRIYEGKILNLEVDEVVLPDGSVSSRECVRHHGGAAVLCVLDGKVLLVKQFRYLYGKEIYEIPAGKLEKGENPKDAAARELREETGYVANDLKPFLKIFPTPGYTDEIIHVYLAKCCGLGSQQLDKGEFLNVNLIKIEEVLKMIESGEICDSKTLSAIYKYLYENK